MVIIFNVFHPGTIKAIGLNRDFPNGLIIIVITLESAGIANYH